MKLPARLIRWLHRRLVLVTHSRAPDQIIGGQADPYLLRWYLIPRNPIFNLYLHRFLRSDDDRALHDHPWFNASLLLEGAYTEHTIAAGGIHRRTLRRKGDVIVRSPWHAHRVELLVRNVVVLRPDGRPTTPPQPHPALTLFITGPRMRGWGFHCPERGWVHWREFTDPDDSGTIGPGCGA
jgi:hypothetical protein